MHRTRLTLATLAWLASLPSMATAAPAIRPPADAPARTVSVPGEGEAKAAPDEVTFTVGVVREGADAKVARHDLTNATRSVLAALKQRGVADADVQTAASSLVPNDRFDGGKRTIAGYRAVTAMTVRLRAIDGYDAVLSAAMQAGANEFHGAHFGSSKIKELETQARANAVADAKRRAEALTASAGARIGRVLSIAEGHVERPPLPMAAQMRAMGGLRGELPPGDPSLAGGEITVRVSIQATWELE